MVCIRCNFTCCYKGFVLWIFIEGVPLNSFLNRIFRVALLFICQCSFFFFVAFLLDATLIDYHKLLCLVKHFFNFFHFLVLRRWWSCLPLYWFASATKLILPLRFPSVNYKFYFLFNFFPASFFVNFLCHLLAKYICSHFHGTDCYQRFT